MLRFSQFSCNLIHILHNYNVKLTQPFLILHETSHNQWFLSTSGKRINLRFCKVYYFNLAVHNQRGIHAGENVSVSLYLPLRDMPSCFSIVNYHSFRKERGSHTRKRPYQAVPLQYMCKLPHNWK